MKTTWLEATSSCCGSLARGGSQPPSCCRRQALNKTVALGALAYISLSSSFGFNCLFLYVLMVLVWVADFFFFFGERDGYIWGWGFLWEKRERVLVRWTELKGALVKHNFLYKILCKCENVMLLWHDITTRFVFKFSLTQRYNKAP